MDNLLKQVQSLLPADNGTWSVYVCNLPKDSEGMINDTPMQAASLIKLYIMGAVYENYDTLSQSHNGDEIDSNISAMITVSDNDAANTLVNWLGNGDDSAGMAKVNGFCQEHGFPAPRWTACFSQVKKTATTIHPSKTVEPLKQIYQTVNGTLPASTLPNADAMYYHLKCSSVKNRRSRTTSRRRRYCQ